MIYQGAPVTVLAEIFHTRRQIVERKLADCPIAGYGNQDQPFYQIGEAARYLVKIKLTDKMIRETLQKSDPRDFPAMTNKIFWESLSVRRKVEEQTSELWHTTDIEAVASAAFGAIRTALLLLPDNIADNAGLNEKQRATVQGIVDTALENCGESLVAALEKPSRQEQGSSSEEGEI
jgi:hypothetical protein